MHYAPIADIVDEVIMRINFYGLLKSFCSSDIPVHLGNAEPSTKPLVLATDMNGGYILRAKRISRLLLSMNCGNSRSHLRG